MTTYVDHRSYGLGYTDATHELLRQLEDRSTLAPGGGYTGPLPDELRDWIACRRAVVDRVRAEDAADIQHRTGLSP